METTDRTVDMRTVTETLDLRLSVPAALVLGDWLARVEEEEIQIDCPYPVRTVLEQLSGRLESSLAENFAIEYGELVDVAGRFVLESPVSQIAAPIVSDYVDVPVLPEYVRGEELGSGPTIRFLRDDPTARARLLGIRRTWNWIRREVGEISPARARLCARAIIRYFAHGLDISWGTWHPFAGPEEMVAQPPVVEPAPVDAGDTEYLEFGFIEPEVPGCAHARGDDSTPLVMFDDWLGDGLVEAHPHYLATTRLVKSLRRNRVTGVEFAPVQVATTPLFTALNGPSVVLPEFERLIITGREGVDDVALDGIGRLVLSASAQILSETRHTLYRNWPGDGGFAGASQVAVEVIAFGGA